MIFFFFTIPIWVIAAIILLFGAAVGSTASWLVSHFLVISLVVWGISLAGVVILSIKYRKNVAVNLSRALLFLPTYILTAALLLQAKRALQRGDLLELLVMPLLFIIDFAFFAGTGSFVLNRPDSEKEGSGAIVINLILTIAFSMLAWYMGGSVWKTALSVG